MTNQNPGPTLFAAIELWRRMTVTSRTAFVKWLAADSSVVLFTQEEVDAEIEMALEKQYSAIPLSVLAQVDELTPDDWEKMAARLKGARK